MGFGHQTSMGGDGAMVEMIAKIQDIKAAPGTGQKRLVIRERGHQAHAVIDIDMRNARDLEERETYIFQVQKKAQAGGGYGRREAKSGFMAYHCEDKPDIFTPEMEHSKPFTRFSGGGQQAAPKRTRF